jgi:hypothetical protein
VGASWIMAKEALNFLYFLMDFFKVRENFAHNPVKVLDMPHKHLRRSSILTGLFILYRSFSHVHLKALIIHFYNFLLPSRAVIILNVRFLSAVITSSRSFGHVPEINSPFSMKTFIITFESFDHAL